VCVTELPSPNVPSPKSQWYGALPPDAASVAASGAAPADDVVFFQAGGMVVALWGREQLAEDSVLEDGGGWGGVTLAHNVRSPAEVDAVIEEARAAGGTVLRDGAATFWGGYSGVFADPDGHPWEVAHNPHWTIGADGSIRLPVG